MRRSPRAPPCHPDETSRPPVFVSAPPLGPSLPHDGGLAVWDTDVPRSPPHAVPSRQRRGARVATGGPAVPSPHRPVQPPSVRSPLVSPGCREPPALQRARKARPPFLSTPCPPCPREFSSPSSEPAFVLAPQMGWGRAARAPRIAVTDNPPRVLALSKKMIKILAILLTFKSST